MTECTRLSDRMAAVAHGRVDWSAEEAAHLGACAECGAEWRVMRVGALVGAEVARTLPTDFLATRVVAAVRAGRSSRGWWARLRWVVLPAAAAATVALLVLPGGRDAASSGSAAGTVEVGVLPELESLDATALESVLELLPATDAPVEIRGFDELSDDEVTQLLTSLEG